MPTYEYLCEKCEHEFEREQRMSDPPVKTCPACKSRRVTKLISRTSFVLKGGGWYSDLYSSSTKDSGKSDSDKESGGTSKSGDTGGDDSKKSKKDEKSSDKSTKSKGKSGSSKKTAA